MSAATRNYVHVNFDKTECPVKGCTSGKGNKPQTGSVPGIKRHVKLVHGQEAYDKAHFPALRTPAGPIKDLPKATLFDAAKSRKLVPADAKEHGYTKDGLIELLTGEKPAG